MTGSSSSLYGAVRAILRILTEVLFFWQLRLYAWWKQPPKQYVAISQLDQADTFEEWESAAFNLDELRGNDVWRQNAASKDYDYRLIFERLQALIETREDDDILGLVNLLRSGLVRNLGNITAAGLFNRAFAGTKLLIEDYVTHVAQAVAYVASYPTSLSAEDGLTNQAKLDVLHDTRQAFGRSALILRGGAIFGLCHIGVIKALHLRGLLPRIIVGTSTGALIAALVGASTEDELLGFLKGDEIDLSAFAAGRSGVKLDRRVGWLDTFNRRLSRFVKHGYFLDVRILEECVRANIGDITFEEAYARTKRVLNITIATVSSDGSSGPSLLNYITAPNVLIWSAAAASNTGSGPLYSPVTLLCKTDGGSIRPWSSRPSTPVSSRRTSYSNSGLPSSAHTIARDTPMSRVAELFNVNHFIVSQARPSIAPFLQTTADTSHRYTNVLSRIWQPIQRVVVLEAQHRVAQAAALGILPSMLAHLLLDEPLPGESLTLVPQLQASDFIALLERPTATSVERWIWRGERSVWPAISAIRVRCAIEFELDRAYQVVRRRKPMDAVPLVPMAYGAGKSMREATSLRGGGERRRRGRERSLDEGERSSARSEGKG